MKSRRGAAVSRHPPGLRRWPYGAGCKSGAAPSDPAKSDPPDWPRRHSPRPHRLSWPATNRQNAGPAWTCRHPAAPSAADCDHRQRQSPAHASRPFAPSHHSCPGTGRARIAAPRWPLTSPAPARAVRRRLQRAESAVPHRADGRHCRSGRREPGPLLRHCPGVTRGASPRPRRAAPNSWPGHHAPVAVHRTGTVRQQTRSPPGGLHQSVHWPPEYPGRWADRSGRNPWAGLPAPD